MAGNQEQWITMVEAQQNHSQRYNIYINDEFAFSVHEDLLVKQRLLKGNLLDDASIQRILAEESLDAAYRSAIHYIGRAMKTAKEVERKLIMKGYSEELAIEVVHKLREQGYIDDEFYASALARQRLHANQKGSMWIKRELGQKGVSRSEIEQAIAQFDVEDEQAQAWELVCKRWPRTKGEPAARLHKMMGLLQRRGFAQDAVRYALARLRSGELDGQAEGDEYVELDTHNGYDPLD